MKAEELERLKADHVELLKMHAKVGCEFVSQKVPTIVIPSDIVKWIDDGMRLATDLQAATNSLVSAYDRYEEYETIIDQLKTIDPIVAAGAIDVKKLSENVRKMDENMIRKHKSWRIILKALAAAFDMNIHESDDDVETNDTEDDEVKKLQQTFPKIMRELSGRLSEIGDTDRQIMVPGFPLEQFKITKRGDIIDRTVDRPVKLYSRTDKPALFRARNAATGKVETVSIDDIKIPEGYSVTVPKTTNNDDDEKPISAKTNNGWIQLNIDKLPEDRFVYNKTTGEIVDRRTGLKVTKRQYRDGMKYLFDIDGKITYIRCSDVEEMFNEPKQEPKPEAEKEQPKEQPQVPRTILIDCKPLDWLGPLIDTRRYLIYSDGRIQDTKANKPVFPVNSCQVILEAIDGSKGTWNIHELVWSAFHPDDRGKIRVSGGVFKINGHADDNRLSNLVFKPTTVQVVNSLTNLPTQTTNMTGGKQEEKPKLDESVKVESRLIDWIAGIDPSKYSISRDGTIVNNHAGGKEIVSKMHAGKRVVKLQGKKGKNATYAIADLVNRAYPDQPHAIRSSGKFRIEDVTRPLDRNTVVDEPTEETSESERMIPVDWIDGIPATKYLVSEQGYVFNTISGKRIVPNASGTINMSDSIDKGSRKLRIHMKMESLIWKAFHAEDRQLEKVYLEHIDGDSANCAIKNLRKKIVDRKR